MKCSVFLITYLTYSLFVLAHLWNVDPADWCVMTGMIHGVVYQPQTAPEGSTFLFVITIYVHLLNLHKKLPLNSLCKDLY